MTYVVVAIQYVRYGKEYLNLRPLIFYLYRTRQHKWVVGLPRTSASMATTISYWAGENLKASFAWLEYRLYASFMSTD